MHILITGGSGFIGRKLVGECLARGHRVTVLTRDRASAQRVLPPQTHLDDELFAPAPDAVVNLAGENLGAQRWDETRKRAFVDSRVATTHRLVDWMACLRERPRVLISGSAVGYYGARGDEPLTEDAPPGEEFQSDLCSAWEAEALGAEALGVRVCRIRIGVVLDRDGGALDAMRTPFRLGVGGRFGSGRQWMSWIHRADLVALILWLLGNGRCSGAYNATAPHPVTNREFTRAFARALHRPALVPMPAPVVRLAVGEMAHLLLTGQRVVPRRALAEGFTFRYPEITAAMAASA